MTALSAAAAYKSRNAYVVQTGELVMASNITIYQGSLVALDGSGNMIAAVDTASRPFMGICQRTTVNPSGGSVTCPFEFGDEYLLTHDGSLAATDVGTAVAEVGDSGTVVKSSTNHIKVGLVVEYVSATQVWVAVRVAKVV